jgi:hypothetical protein
MDYRKNHNTEILLAALDYEKLGWSIIPILPGEKTPCVKWKEFQSRRATPKEIRGWWHQWPKANVAVVTGEISGIDCIDGDGPFALGNLKNQSGMDLPETVSQTTGRANGGEHLIYKYHGDGCLKNWKGIAGNGNGSQCDIKTNGGYFLAAPSIHPSGKEYKWIVDPLIEDPEPFPPGIKKFITGWAQKTGDDGERKRVNPDEWFQTGIPNGRKYEDFFRYACKCISRNMAFDEVCALLEELGNRCDPPPREGAKAAAVKIATEAFKKYGDQSKDPKTDEPLKDFPPLTPEQTAINISEEPPLPPALIAYHDRTVLTRGIVGEVTASGGTGKTFFLQQLAYTMADGANLGPLKAVNPEGFKVLMLCGEDPQGEVNRRLWAISRESGYFPPKLHVVSTMGHLGPLMVLEDNNPKKSVVWYWLRETIQNHEGLDMLFIDPKSRFYGLNENDNDHATQWIACLESLAQEFNITILFANHVSKANGGTMNQNMSRGASAIVDGCRWVAGMTPLSDTECQRYGIDDPRGYVVLDIVKSNYAAGLSSKIIFQRTETGVLEYAALEADRRSMLFALLYDAIENDHGKFSKRDFAKNENGAGDIVHAIQEQFPKFQKKEIPRLIDAMIDGYLLDEKNTENTGKGRPKKTLITIPIDPMNFNQTRF